MSDKKPNSLLEVLKNAQKNLKVSPNIAKQIQKTKIKNQVTTNRPTKRAAGRGG
jgi:hypothetical protein